MDLRSKILLLVGYLVTLVLIRWVVLTRKRQPASTIAWILTIIVLPYLGGMLYLFFGINRVERRKRGKAAASRDFARLRPPLEQYEEGASRDFSEQQRRLMRLTQEGCDTLPTIGNAITLLNDTNVILRRIEEAIMAARESVHLEYYIWRADATGRRVRDLLIERARAGVKVRFLYDSLGSLYLGREFLHPMRDAGITVATFLPGQSFRERWSFNLRSHRKLVVVDGRVGFTGGMNIGDEYLGRNKLLGFWRDTHLQMTGPVVLQLQQVFAEDWYYATGEELTLPERVPESVEQGDIVAQVVSGGPTGEMRTFHLLMFSAINEAQQSITLATSYFVPTEALMLALETAAHRGVRVRLLLAGRAVYRWTVLAGRSYYEPLLEAGVEIYEYRRGILHAKTLTIDGHWSLVGTANFDSRSLLLNFEVGVAVYNPAFADELEAQFAEDLRHAKQIRLDYWVKRPLRQVFIENLCRLGAPLL